MTRSVPMLICTILIVMWFWVIWQKAGEEQVLRIHTDIGTGCQYLRFRGSGLTPRMGADGKQVCEVAR